MTADDARSELAALMTRASIAEAQRQRARERGDWHVEAQAERELRALWKRHAELEAIERVA